MTFHQDHGEHHLCVKPFVRPDSSIPPLSFTIMMFGSIEIIDHACDLAKLKKCIRHTYFATGAAQRSTSGLRKADRDQPCGVRWCYAGLRR